MIHNANLLPKFILTDKKLDTLILNYYTKNCIILCGSHNFQRYQNKYPCIEIQVNIRL
jgi:hypothetical protein